MFLALGSFGREKRENIAILSDSRFRLYNSAHTFQQGKSQKNERTKQDASKYSLYLKPQTKFLSPLKYQRFMRFVRLNFCTLIFGESIALSCPEWCLNRFVIFIVTQLHATVFQRVINLKSAIAKRLDRLRFVREFAATDPERFRIAPS